MLSYLGHHYYLKSDLRKWRVSEQMNRVSEQTAISRCVTVWQNKLNISLRFIFLLLFVGLYNLWFLSFLAEITSRNHQNNTEEPYTLFYYNVSHRFQLLPLYKMASKDTLYEIKLRSNVQIFGRWRTTKLASGVHFPCREHLVSALVNDSKGQKHLPNQLSGTAHSYTQIKAASFSCNFNPAQLLN